MTFKTSREIPATPEQIFAAFDPERLKTWWGPEGFTNIFEYCDFKQGGKWKFIMQSAEGHKYPNESLFAEVVPARKVVVQHISNPKYRLTIDLTKSATGTTVSWSQAFEDADVAKRIEHIVVPANEQNLDRLTAEVLRVV